MGSIHAALVVVVVVFAPHLYGAVAPEAGDRGVGYAVEHGGFDGGVVYHVFEDDALAHGELVVEVPVAHVVAAQARVAAHAVGVQAGGRSGDGAADGGLVGHLETVGHVAGKGYVEYGGAYAVVLDDVDHGRYQRARLPAECAAGLEYDLEVGVALLEVAQESYQVVGVVALAGHQVAAAHVEPFDLRQQVAESLFDPHEGLLEVVGGRLAQRVEVQPLDALRQVRQLVGRDAQPRTGGTGVVEVGLDLGVFGVDAQSARHAVAVGHDLGVEVLELAQRVEGDVAAVPQDGGEIALGVGWRIGVGGAAHLFEGEPGLVYGAGGGAGDVFPDDGERLPQGVGLECQYDVDPGGLLDRADELQVAAQACLLEHVAGRWYLR